MLPVPYVHVVFTLPNQLSQLTLANKRTLYVPEGSVTDSDGVTTHAEDFASMPANITHRPMHTDTGCVFLIAFTN